MDSKNKLCKLLSSKKLWVHLLFCLILFICFIFVCKLQFDTGCIQVILILFFFYLLVLLIVFLRKKRICSKVNALMDSNPYDVIAFVCAILVFGLLLYFIYEKAFSLDKILLILGLPFRYPLEIFIISINGLTIGYFLKYTELFLKNKLSFFSSKSGPKNAFWTLILAVLFYMFIILDGYLLSNAFNADIANLYLYYLFASIIFTTQITESYIEKHLEMTSNKAKLNNVKLQVLNPTDGKPIEISKDIIATLETDNGPIQIKISKSEE